MATDIAPPESDLSSISKYLHSRPLWRLFGWGSAACIALVAVAFVSRSDAANERLRIALAAPAEPAQAIAQIPPRAAETEAETKRLAAQVRELAADRERLTARIAMLEHNFEDMTGSIKRQSEQLAAAHAGNTPPPAPNAPASKPAVVALAEPPSSSAPATAPPVVAVPLPPVRAVARLEPLAMPAAGKGAASSPAAQPDADEIEKSPEAAEGAVEPGQMAAVPLPPVRVAMAPTNQPAAESPSSAGTPFGVDLGGASNIETLRVHWAALKANYGPLLKGLEPIVAERAKQPAGVSYRLVVGPLPNAAEVTGFCARFPVLWTGCRPARYSGVRLAAH